jgi:hypothetical protein
MSAVIDPIETWFVVFSDTEPDQADWWRWLTRPGFRHVFALGVDRKGRWFLIDWTWDTVALVSLDGLEVDQLVLGIQLTGGRILKFHRWPSRARRTPVLCWCVPFIKHLIGLPSHALTPYQLYCDMLNSGATHAFEETDDGRTPQDTAA